MEPKDEPPPPHLSATDARGGEVILDTALRRWVFVAGVVAAVVLAAVIALLLRW
ncbi:MAG: hypothetical protein ACOY45_02295 [Pseudomonadota bacterium]